MVILYGFFALSFLASGFVLAACMLSARITHLESASENLSPDLEFQLELVTPHMVAPNGR